MGFVMLNIVTGVFVDTAMKVATEETDLQVATNISALYLGYKNSIRWEDFRSKLKESAMQEYFKGINVDISVAREIFNLLDGDGSGTLDADEMVKGLVRLRGTATQVDLSMLLQRQWQMMQ